MVSVHALDPDNPISDLGEAYIFVKNYLKRTKINKKRPVLGHLKMKERLV